MSIECKGSFGGEPDPGHQRTIRIMLNKRLSDLMKTELAATIESP